MPQALATPTRPIAYYDVHSRTLREIDDAHHAICRAAPQGALAEAHANVAAIQRIATAINRFADECHEAASELSETCQSRPPHRPSDIAAAILEALDGQLSLTTDAARLLAAMVA